MNFLFCKQNNKTDQKLAPQMGKNSTGCVFFCFCFSNYDFGIYHTDTLSVCFPALCCSAIGSHLEYMAMHNKWLFLSVFSSQYTFLWVSCI